MRSTILFTSVSASLTGCIFTKPTPSTTKTSDSATSVGVEFLGEEDTLYGAWTARVGTDLAFLGDGRLLIGAPSDPQGEPWDQEDDQCWVAERREGVLSTGDGDEVGALLLDDTWYDPNDSEQSIPAGNHFGQTVVTPGDVTGDGVADIVIGDRPHDSLLKMYWGVFAGPDYTIGFPLPWQYGSSRAAPCGDLDADGISELCTADGVFFGPLTEETLYALSWIAEDPFVTAADLDADAISELVVSDAANHAVYHLSSLTRAGEVTLADIADITWTASNGSATALASGDLDGDGTEELIVGWTGDGDDVVLVGPSPSGGDLFSGARNTLPGSADDLAIGDFDGDGQSDLAVGGASEVTVWLGPIGTAPLHIEDADARYRGLQYPADQLGFALAAADTDGDGRSDLAIGAPLDNTPEEPCQEPANNTCSGRVWWLLGAEL